MPSKIFRLDNLGYIRNKKLKKRDQAANAGDANIAAVGDANIVAVGDATMQEQGEEEGKMYLLYA